MNELDELLKELFPNIDFDREKSLIDDGIFDSTATISLIAELEDRMDIEIPMEYIDADHFNSKEAIAAMIEELK